MTQQGGKYCEGKCNTVVPIFKTLNLKALLMHEGWF